MQPDNTRGVTVPPRNTSTPTQKPDRDLAVSLMRQQIDHLYDEPVSSPSTQPQALKHAYDKTHDDSSHHAVNTEQWQQYHTAWQQYYQQYYERYYLAQAQARQQQIAAQDPIARISHHTFPHNNETSNSDVVTKDRALYEIKSELMTKIQSHARTIRKNRHFVPALSALTVMIAFLFLQFEGMIVSQIKYYLSPSSANAQTVIFDTTSSTKVSPEPRLIIPKLNVDTPVVYDVLSVEEAPVQAGLRRGIVHYNVPGASAKPGEQGNALFLGHSSGSVFNDNPYKFIFVQLEQLVPGDKFFINYNSVRYTYVITSTESILPTEVSKLIKPDTKPMATLITCTPVGTNYKRFIVFADQISPDPTKAAATSQQAPASQPPTITGNTPTLFERLFGF